MKRRRGGQHGFDDALDHGLEILGERPISILTFSRGLPGFSFETIAFGCVRTENLDGLCHRADFVSAVDEGDLDIPISLSQFVHRFGKIEQWRGDAPHRDPKTADAQDHQHREARSADPDVLPGYGHDALRRNSHGKMADDFCLAGFHPHDLCWRDLQRSRRVRIAFACNLLALGIRDFA